MARDLEIRYRILLDTREDMIHYIQKYRLLPLRDNFIAHRGMCSKLADVELAQILVDGRGKLPDWIVQEIHTVLDPDDRLVVHRTQGDK